MSLSAAPQATGPRADASAGSSSLEPARLAHVVNNFSIQVATINGSGSQTANNVLMRSIFQMGVPVSGKNMFPSNIAGLPTWFTIRANKHGYIGRKKEVDFLVAMNPDTAREDVMNLDPGAAVLYDEPLKLKDLRSDLHFYAAPFDKLVGPVCPEAKLRKLVKNMLYPGALAYLLGIELEEIRKALYKQFGPKKQKAAELNWGAVQAGWKYASENYEKTDPFAIERMGENRGKIIVDGNTASALGCVFAGCTMLAWYPITPSSTMAEAMIGYLNRLRIDPETGKATYAVIQAEDELAAVGMAIGAGWAGARAMTCTSGPGISLMAEFVGLAYWVEVPVVIVDVQRVGPSTGMPTRTAQGDTMKNALLSHGDTRHPVLFPSSLEECFSFPSVAFDIAERFQTPVFINTDLDLGMNNWMSDAFTYPEGPIDRGKVLTADDLDRVGEFARYRDVDGDAIGYRTLPGTNHPAAAWFARGSGHNDKAQYSEREDDYVNKMNRLSRKFDFMRGAVPKPEIKIREGARIGLVCYGTSRYACEEACDQLRDEYNLPVSYLRVKAYPFTAELEEFIDDHQTVYVVEQNRDAQLLLLMRMEMNAERIRKLRPVVHFSGMPIDARSVTSEISGQEGL